MRTEEIQVSRNVHYVARHRAFLPGYDRCCLTGRTFDQEDLRDSLRPIIPYPTGRFFRGTLPRHFVPATIVLSLRDEKYRLEAYATLTGARFEVGCRLDASLAVSPGLNPIARFWPTKENKFLPIPLYSIILVSIQGGTWRPP